MWRRPTTTFIASASGMKPDVDVKAIGDLKTKAEIVAALEGSFAFAHKAVATLTTDERLSRRSRGVDGMSIRQLR